MKMLKKVLALIAATALVCAASGVSAQPLFDASVSLKSDSVKSEVTYLTFDEAFDVTLHLKTGADFYAGPFSAQVFYTSKLFKNTSSAFNKSGKYYSCSKSYSGVTDSSSMTVNAKKKFYPAGWNTEQKNKFSFCNVIMVPNSADCTKSVDNLDEDIVTLHFKSGKDTGSGTVFISADSLKTPSKIYGETYLSALTDGGNVLSTRYDYGSDAVFDLANAALSFVVTDAGDVDGSKKVNSTDALIILQHVTELKKQSGDALRRSDIDGNGSVNSIDALCVLQVSAQIVKINDIIKK